MTKTEDSSSSSTAPLSQPKCPISGQEAKNGETCAYDPTKMSFWTSKPAAAKAKPVEQQVVSEPESCPMRAKSDTSSSADKYKNPNQYNVSNAVANWLSSNETAPGSLALTNIYRQQNDRFTAKRLTRLIICQQRQIKAPLQTKAVF